MGRTTENRRFHDGDLSPVNCGSRRRGDASGPAADDKEAQPQVVAHEPGR